MFNFRRFTDKHRILTDVVSESRVVVFRAHYVGGWPLTFISENISVYGHNAAILTKRQTQLKDLIHADDWAELSKNLPAKPKEMLRLSLNLRLYDATDTYHTVAADLQLINKPNSVGFYIQGTFQKNTSEKVIPLLTALKFGQLSQLIDMLPIPALVVQGHDFHSNSMVENLTGYRSDEVFTVHNWFYLLFPGGGQDMEEQYFKNRARGFPEPETLEITRKDGETRWVTISIHKIEKMELWFFHDVTDLRVVNSALKRQQELFHQVIDALPVMVLMYDNQGKFKFYNKTLKKNTGYNQEDIKAPDFFNKLYPSQSYRQEIKNHMHSRSPEWRQVEITSKDGSILKSSWTNIVFDEETRIGIGLDVTLIDQLQQTLKTTRHQFRVIANQLEDIVFILDKNKRYTGIYGTWMVRTGFKEKDFIGKSAIDFFGETGKRIHDIHHERALRGIPSSYEFMMELKGEKVWIRSSVSPFRDQNGAIIGAIGVGHDITALKKTDEQLAIHQQGLEASVIAIMVVDDNGIIKWANPAASHLTGYPVLEILGNSISMFKSDEQDTNTYKTLWETVTAGKIWTGELINRKKDGATYVERQTITPFTGLDGHQFYICVKIDVTEYAAMAK